MSDTPAPGLAGPAERLDSLRRSAERADFAPGALACSVSDAYAVAAKLVARAGETPAAWKLGGVTAGMRAAFGATDVCYGAVYPAEIGGAGELPMPPAPPRFQAEAEIALRLAGDVVAKPDLRRLARAQLFDAWTYALEAPYSVVANLPAAGLPALLADRCAAGALYLAAPRPIDDAIGPAPLQIVQSGEVVAEGCVADALLMPPRESAMRFLELALAAGQVIRKGQWISTGGVTPCVPLDRARPVELRHGAETVLTIDPAQAAQ